MTEQLIDTIVANLAPVRRYRSPWLRASAFLAFAAVLAVMVAVLHQKEFYSSAVSQVSSQSTLYGALLTGVLATLAAFMIGQPERSRLWSLLPVPGFILWMSAMGYQCLSNWVSFRPDGITAGETAQCFATLFVMAAPLSLAAMLMLKTMAVLEPTRITVLTSLAIAGITAAAMDLFHPADASLLIIMFNLGTACLILGGGWLLRQINGTPA